MNAPTLPIDPPTERDAGLVGRRQLVAVQTFHIARLTSHPVVLRPGSFVAVTGKGPKGDSNESGKTSFLAAAGLLLADPEWRLDAGVGGKSAAELLFEPETAGASAQRVARPDHGYVVGVFAEPEDVAGTALTVWCRIATTSPHLKVRWAEGLHLATADTDRERHREADERWKALAANEAGAKTYREALYGDTPRCLAYVARRGGLRSKPSILQMDAGAFSPTDIATALIALTGRSAAFDTEADQRRQLAETDEQLETARRHDADARRDEDADLAEVAGRDRARACLDEASHHWRLHFARGLLDVLDTAEALDAELAEIHEELEATEGAVVEADRALGALADRSVLERTLAEAAERAGRLADEAQAARHRQTQAQTLRGTCEERANELRVIAGDADGRGRDEYAAALQAANTERDEALAAHGVAASRSQAAREQLAAVEQGKGGAAGHVRDVLSGAGIDAEVLLDAVTLADDGTADEARASWEPRLAGYQDAVVVDADDQQAAVAAAPPGAILVAGEADDGELPTGIAAAPRAARRFLRALAASGTSGLDPDRVTFAGLGVTVVGGFHDPITGRQARVAAARRTLGDCEAEEAAARQRLAAAERRVELAEHARAAADAAHELAGLRRRLNEHDEAVAAAEAQLDRLQPQLDDAEGARRRAENAVENHDLARQQAERRLEQARSERDGKRREHDDVTARREALPLAYWQQGWGGTHEEAEAALAEEPRGENRLRRVASDLLREALQALGIDREGFGAPTEEIAGIAKRRETLEADADGEPSRRVADFATVTAPLREWLDTLAEQDRFVEDTINANRAQRADQLAALQRERGGLADALSQIQDAVEQRITQTLQEIAAELDRLDRSADGFGADLRVESRRPEGPTDVWEWRVTPLWRRAAGGRLVRYDNQTNSAREKLFTVHLVLAALLAAPDPTGRVLILDELGDSLGVTHRRDVLAAVADVARERGITVLGTCQDAVLPDATRVAGEILYFSYPSRAELLNHPVRCWGFDANRERVELTVDALRVGRPPV